MTSDLVPFFCFFLFCWSCSDAFMPALTFAPNNVLTQTRSIQPKIFSASVSKDISKFRRVHSIRMSMGSAESLIPAIASVSILFPSLDFLVQAPGHVWAEYESLLEQHPHAVDSLTGVILYMLGTLTSGAITREPIPAPRLLRWMIFGSVDGYMTHDWYQAVDSLGTIVGGDGWGKPAFMIAADTLIYTPVYCLVFIVVMALLEGRGVGSAVEQVRTDLPDLAKASVSAWLPFNSAIYGLVPLRLRLPTAMLVHFLYSVALALWEVGFIGHSKASVASSHKRKHGDASPDAREA